MKGLYLRGKIYWLRYADASGKVVFESAKTNNKRDAERLLIKRRGEVMQGAKFGLNATLDEAVALYLEHTETKCKSIRNIKSFCRRLLKILPPKLKLNNIGIKEFEIVQNALLKQGLKKYSVNVQTAYFKALLYRAIELGLCSRNLADTLKKVKGLKGAIEKRTDYLELDEIEKLSSCLTGESRLKFIIFVNTGMRLMELHNLKWGDIQGGFILISQSKSGKPRQIPMNETVKQVFSSLIRPINNVKIFKENASKFSKEFREGINRSGITKNIVVHSLRHTFASHMVMNGTDLPTLQALLGHSSISMVLRYSHLSNEHTKRAVDKIGSIFQKAVNL